jgi:hypothetical protein
MRVLHYFLLTYCTIKYIPVHAPNKGEQTVNTKSSAVQRYERPDGADSKPAQMSRADAGANAAPSIPNPWYNPPDYKDTDDLCDNQVAARMDYLKFQIGILGEAAEFELSAPEQGRLLAAISKYRIERDALGEHLCKRIVQGDLHEAKEHTRRYENDWIVRPTGIEAKPQPSKVRDVMADQGSSQNKSRSFKQMNAPTIVRKGIGRTHKVSTAVKVPAHRPTNQKGKHRPRIVHISISLKH